MTSSAAAQEEELCHLALDDPLTRLANRTLFTEHVDHALARTHRSPGAPARRAPRTSTASKRSTTASGTPPASGLIRPMGRWILNEACHQRQRWKKQLRAGPPFAMSVNVSPVQMEDPAFVDDLVACLEAFGTEADALTLEITESLFMRNFPSAVEKLQEVRKRA